VSFETNSLQSPPHPRDELYRQALHDANIFQLPSILRRILNKEDSPHTKRLSSHDLESAWGDTRIDDFESHARSLPAWTLNDTVLRQILAIEQDQVEYGSASVDTLSSFSSYGAITPHSPVPEPGDGQLVASKVAQSGTQWFCQADSSNRDSNITAFPRSKRNQTQRTKSSHDDMRTPFPAFRKTQNAFARSCNESVGLYSLCDPPEPKQA